MHANHYVSIWWFFKRKWRGPFKNFGWSSPFQSLPALPLKPRPCASPVQGLHRIGWLKGWEKREGALWALIRHHQMEQSSALARTAERHSGLRRTDPEPRAPIPATQTSRVACHSNQKRQPCMLLCYPEKNVTSLHKSKANFSFCFQSHIIAGIQQERLFKYPEKIKFVSHQRGERQIELPHHFAQQWDGSTELLYMLQHCAASQQGIITQWQRWMTSGTHF